MGDISAEATIAGSSARAASPVRQTSQRAYFALVAGVAFGLYWFSSYMLLARGATMYFGVDTDGYTEFAEGDVLRRMVTTYDLDRIIRFHLTTATLAVTWMKILGPLTRWIAPLYLLKALFSLIGAAGVWAAMAAFASVMPRRYVIFFGIVYAVSFSVWYFSSIQELKIVSGTLAAIYVAIYLRLRDGMDDAQSGLADGCPAAGLHERDGGRLSGRHTRRRPAGAARPGLAVWPVDRGARARRSGSPSSFSRALPMPS